MIKLTTVLLAGLTLCIAGPALAQDAKKAPAADKAEAGHPAVATPEKHHDLTTDATNPVGALIQLQLQNQYIPESDNSSGGANNFIVQPVIPFSLGKDNYFSGVVTRTGIPVVTTPKVNGNRETAIGDTTAIGAATHTKQLDDGFFTWGPVAAALVPTATKRETGSGVLSIGPGIVGLRNFKSVPHGPSLMIGALAYQTWGVTNGKNSNFNKTWAQPVIVYKFAKLFDQPGWYLRNPDDLWSYDWNENELDQAPIGAYMGRVFAIGKQPVNMFGGAWYNPAGADRGTTPKYSLKFNLTFLFPG